MKLMLGVILSVIVAPASVYADARHDTAEGQFVMFNACTEEDVLVATTNHYLVFGHGDLTHSSGGTGTGLTTGMEYLYVRRGFETNTQGFYEVIHLISIGPGSDMTLTDDLGDVEDATVTCH